MPRDKLLFFSFFQACHLMTREKAIYLRSFISIIFLFFLYNFLEEEEVVRGGGGSGSGGA